MSESISWPWEDPKQGLPEVIRCLRPLPRDRERQRTVVGKIATVLRESKELKESLGLAEVVSAGSHGRGTDIRNNFEVDLVIICNKFSVDAYDGMLENLAWFVQENLETEYVHVGKLRVMLKVDGVIGDLLLGGVMNEERLKRLPYMAPKNRKRWGASCSKLQLEFMRKKMGSSNVLRDGIILAKCWKQMRKAATDSFKWPSSWLLELLATYAMDRAWFRDSISTSFELFIPEPLTGVGLFLSTMQLICLVQCQQVQVVWTKESSGGYYEERDVRALIDYAERQGQPVVSDPVDATNNVAATLSVADWSGLAHEACSMIQRVASLKEGYSALMAPKGLSSPDVNHQNPCQALNEHFQKLGLEGPVYDIKATLTPSPLFICTVEVQLSCQCVIGVSSDEKPAKKQARQSAAEKALLIIADHSCQQA